MFHKITSFLSIPPGEGKKIINYFYYNQINYSFLKGAKSLKLIKLK